MKFAVGHLSYFDNELRLAIVEADNLADALLGGVRKILNIASDSVPDMISWVEGLSGKTVDEIGEEFFNADQIVAAIPVE